jgi:hypothetical protein
MTFPSDPSREPAAGPWPTINDMLLIAVKF